MARRKRRKFNAEFKADAVRLVTRGGRTIAEVTKQFDLTETALRGWVKRAEADAGRGPPDALTTTERVELVDLRKRVKRAEMERDILKNCRARPSRPPARQETRGGRTVASREEWPSTFWCSANP